MYFTKTKTQVNETQVYVTNEMNQKWEETIENYNHKIVSLTHNMNQNKRTPNLTVLGISIHLADEDTHAGDQGRQACSCLPTLISVTPSGCTILAWIGGANITKWRNEKPFFS